MKEKYSVNEVNICTFDTYENGLIRPNLNKYPVRRLCVIDNERKIAIDVMHELKYDFLDTFNQDYFINGSSKKIKPNRRAALFPLLYFSTDLDSLKRVRNIIQKLESGYEFKDGNEVLSNEKYLEIVNQENDKKDERSKAGTLMQKIFRKK